MRVLIVEDEKILSKILKEKFEEKGWSVKTAFDGGEALEMLKEDGIDVVLLDLLLPIKDGFEVLKEIRNDPVHKNLPILVLSNLGGKDEIHEAMRLGATDFFVKTQHSLAEIAKKAASYISR